MELYVTRQARNVMIALDLWWNSFLTFPFMVACCIPSLPTEVFWKCPPCWLNSVMQVSRSFCISDVFVYLLLTVTAALAHLSNQNSIVVAVSHIAITCKVVLL